MRKPVLPVTGVPTPLWPRPQGHIAYGVKIEDRIKVRRGLKLRNAAGTMIVDTRMGREHAIGANGELSCAPDAAH